MREKKLCNKNFCRKKATHRGYCHGHYVVLLHKGEFNLTKEACSVEGCLRLIFGESKICWNHVRKQKKEGSKRWQTIKANEPLHIKVLEKNKIYKRKARNTPEKVIKLRIAAKRLYWTNRERELSRMRAYKNSLSKEQIYEQNQKRNAARYFGGWDNREAVLQRDNEECTQCGMSREEHKRRWHQDLHVDHIDNYGRKVVKEKKNNNLENLITLCVRCHAIKTNYEDREEKRIEEILLYGKDFTEKLKEKVRIRDGRICQMCQVSERKLRKRLSIHHLDGNKKNNKLENLLSLCNNCHWKKEHTRVV